MAKDKTNVKPKTATHIRKMSGKSLGFDEKTLQKLVDEKGFVGLYQLAGKAVKTESGETQYGTYHSFGGSFAAKRLSDNQVFTSQKLFLPGELESMLLTAMTGDNGEINPVEFKILVGIEPTSAGSGYCWTGQPVGKFAVENPAVDLLEAEDDFYQLESK